MAGRVENQTAVERFWELALAMEIKGDRWRASSYLKASRSIEELSEPLLAISERGELRKIEGVGESIAAKLDELLSSGRIEALEAVRDVLPDDLSVFRDAPALGLGRVAEVVSVLGVRSVDALLRALDENLVASALGEDVKRRMREWLTWRRGEAAEIPAPYALVSAERIISCLCRTGSVDRIELTGPARRKVPSVANITLLFTSPSPDMAIARFGLCPEVTELTTVERDLAVGRTASGVGCMMRAVREEQFGLEQLRRTGPEEHAETVLRILEVQGAHVERTPFPREEDAYALAGMTYRAPVLRGIPDDAPLIPPEAIRGDLRVRSILMDGTIHVLAVAHAAASLGHELVCICDRLGPHMDVERLMRRNELIDEVGDTTAVTLLKGVEVDITPDGRLDAPAMLLEDLDLVIASVNTGLQMGEEDMVRRITTAMDDPGMDVLGHPSGRVLGLRERTIMDLRPVAERAAERKVALEINAHPDRQDLDDNDAHGLYEEGAFYSLGTDSSPALRANDWSWAVTMVRKAQVGPERLLNALPPNALRRRAWRN